MRNRREYRIAAGVIALLLLVGGLLVWQASPMPSVELPQHQLADTQLEPDRQVVHVKLDSLTYLLTRLQRENPNGFRWETKGNRLHIEAGSEIKLFNQLFFEGSSLAEYKPLTNSPLEVSGGGNAFELPIITRDDTELVTLPADVLHNLQLYQQSQRL